jgi:hypothetical protein
MKRRGHEGGGTDQICRFTADGSLRRTTVIAWVKTLTGDDIKKLSGLDDIRVLKGRDNFIRARWAVDELCRPERLGITDEEEIGALQEKAVALKRRIDETETFYMTGWNGHVESHAKFACCCLDRGFYDAEADETIVCRMKDKAPDQGGTKTRATNARTCMQ